MKARNEKYDGLPCEVWPIRHTELTSDGYRNKCEFTIGEIIKHFKSCVLPTFY